MFILENFDDWKILMQAHMFALYDKMCDVIIDELVQIMKVIIAFILDPNADKYILKPKIEWTLKDQTKNNLNNIAHDILFKFVNKKKFFPRIKVFPIAKEVWE